MKYVDIALLVIPVAAMLVFGLQNRTTVTAAFLSCSTTLPRFVVVIGACFLSMASGGTVVGFLRHSVQKARKRPGSLEGGTRK